MVSPAEGWSAMSPNPCSSTDATLFDFQPYNYDLDYLGSPSGAVCLGNAYTGLTKVYSFGYYLRLGLAYGVYPIYAHILDPTASPMSIADVLVGDWQVLGTSQTNNVFHMPVFPNPPTLDPAKTYYLVFCANVSHPVSKLNAGWYMPSTNGLSNAVKCLSGPSCALSGTFEPINWALTMQINYTCTPPSPSPTPTHADHDADHDPHAIALLDVHPHTQSNQLAHPVALQHADHDAHHDAHSIALLDVHPHAQSDQHLHSVTLHDAHHDAHQLALQLPVAYPVAYQFTHPLAHGNRKSDQLPNSHAESHLVNHSQLSSGEVPMLQFTINSSQVVLTPKDDQGQLQSNTTVSLELGEIHEVTAEFFVVSFGYVVNGSWSRVDNNDLGASESYLYSARLNITSDLGDTILNEARIELQYYIFNSTTPLTVGDVAFNALPSFAKFTIRIFDWPWGSSPQNNHLEFHMKIDPPYTSSEQTQTPTMYNVVLSGQYPAVAGQPNTTSALRLLRTVHLDGVPVYGVTFVFNTDPSELILFFNYFESTLVYDPDVGVRVPSTRNGGGEDTVLIVCLSVILPIFALFACISLLLVGVALVMQRRRESSVRKAALPMHDL